MKGPDDAVTEGMPLRVSTSSDKDPTGSQVALTLSTQPLTAPCLDMTKSQIFKWIRQGCIPDLF